MPEFAGPPGSDLATLARWIETAAAVIRSVHTFDSDLLQRQMHQLNNIAAGWALSIDLCNARAMMKEGEQLELQKEE